MNMLTEKCAPDSSRTLGIIHEFRRLYEDKMRIIDSEGGGDCTLQAKLSLQQDWIRDLNEQNEMLVRAVEELEQEATERVIALEEKLRQSSKCACEVMNGYKDLSNAFQHVDALQQDLDTLVLFVKDSCRQHTWDLHELKLRTVRSDFEYINHNGNRNSDENPVDVDELQKEMAKKDLSIKTLQNKLDEAIQVKERIVSEMQIPKECNKCAEMRQSMMDMRDALTAEVADKHDVIMTLKRDVQVLEEQCRKADQQTHFKDDIIKELRKEIKQLKSDVDEKSFNKITYLEAENRELRAAITNATAHLEILEAKTEQFYCENNDWKLLHQDSIERIQRLEAERDEQARRLYELQVQSAQQITNLECLLKEYEANANACQQQQKQLNNCTAKFKDMGTPLVDKCVGECVTGAQKACQTATLEMDDCDSACSLSLKAEEAKLEEVVHGLQSSVSKMMISECQLKQDKARIGELEQQLSCAWRSKECEVEAARTCREQEINNLKQLIDNLIQNLNNEKQRSVNLQKAVDLYRDTVGTMKESEDMFKQEVMGQKRTIHNLQEALVQTKHNLEELQQKSNIEFEEHTILVDKLIRIVSHAEKEIQQYAQHFESFTLLIERLRDENVHLEENLFYNHQDLEMYEMRLAKYQKLYNRLEAQCGTLHSELRMLEEQKNEKDAFVQDLSQNLSECHLELSNLFAVLNNEKHEKEDQSEQITALQTQLNVVSEKLTNALQSLDYEKQENAKLTQSLMKSQNVTFTIKSETLLAHEKLQKAAMKISSDEQKIVAFCQQIKDYQATINLMQNEQEHLKQQLEKAKLLLQEKSCECQRFTEQVHCLQGKVEKDSREYGNTINRLNEQVCTLENNCQQLRKDLKSSHKQLTEFDRNECKIREDLLDKETKFYTQINKFQSEQERLIAVITSLEQQIARMNMQLMDKDRALEMLKANICGQEKVREKQEEIIHLKNEINTLLQTQLALKSENEKLQLQLSHMHATLASNDEKHKMIIAELEACLADLQNDKGFLMRKNEQLVAQLQTLQELCNSKSESVANLEMELTDTRCARDALCNESRQVIDHVKCWLEEQRKINVELNQRIKHKNDIIGKLKHEKRSLLGRLRTNSDFSEVTSSRETNAAQYPRGQSGQYSMQVIHSPPLQRQGVWSCGSVDSAPCSLNDDSDWEPDQGDEQYPQIWIHRVESLTEDLQRSNRYWKHKMAETEFTSSQVSRDK